MLQIEGHDQRASQVVPFVAHRSHAYVRYAYQNYCACLNKAGCSCSIERISPGLKWPSALTMHHGVQVMCSMSSRFVFYDYKQNYVCRFFTMETRNRKVMISSASMPYVLGPSLIWSSKMKYGCPMLRLLLVWCTVLRSILLLISVRGLLNLRTQPV